MSKKRRTREQKEKAKTRHTDYVHPIHIDTPTYTITGLKNENLQEKEIKSKTKNYITNDEAYLKHDILAISAASGIIVAFYILLFVLLNTGALKLNFLGY